MLSTGVIDRAVTLTPSSLQILLVLWRRCRCARSATASRSRARRRRAARRGAAGCGRLPRRLRRDPYVGLAVLAAIGRSADAAPMVSLRRRLRGAGRHRRQTIGLLWSLRREPTTAVPGVRVLELLPAPYGAVARSALLAVLGLFGAGMLRCWS